MKLNDRVALVTGGASGIGAAIVLRFREEGATVLVNDVAASTSVTHVCDISDSAQVAAMFSGLERLDVLVNNAGIAEPPDRWRELNRIAEERLPESPIETHWDVTVTMDDATWRRMMEVHLDGTFFCTREALRIMGPRGRGAIVNLSSTAALSGLPDAPHYAAAKAGILGFTRSVAKEVASRGIRVNAIAPGFTETPMTGHISEKVKKASLGKIPLGRWADPSEIADAALFLASDEASYVTGQCLSPNGGMF